MNLLELSTAIEAVIRPVGDFIRGESAVFLSDKIETKALNSLVSYVDKEAEKALVEGLQRIIPSAGFMAEEGSGEEKKGGYNWVIDPLDGTTNFMHGIPTYAISVGLLHADRLILGVVYELGQDEYFLGIDQQGATCNGKPISVKSSVVLADSLIATGFPYYDFSRLDAYTEVLHTCMRKTRGVRRLGSAATDLAYVACGRFDAFFEVGLHPWDIAGGLVLVREAGGLSLDFGKDAITDRDLLFQQELLSGSPGIVQELHPLITASFCRS